MQLTYQKLMGRFGTLLLTVALVSGLLAVPLGVSAAVTDSGGANATDQVTPGARLAGVVGVQEAEVGGDLSERRYAVRLDNADTDAERAAIVAERRAEIEQRLADHRTELTEARAARQAGNITEGRYRARVATVAAETAATERAAERANETAGQLPREVLAERGVSTDDLDALRDRARELGGGETAAIAREIGGPNVTRPAAGRTRGPPGEAGARESPTRGPEATPGGETPADERRSEGRPVDRGEATETPGNDRANPDDRATGAEAGRDRASESGNSADRPTDRGNSASPGTDQRSSGRANEQNPGNRDGAESRRGPTTGGQPPR